MLDWNRFLIIFLRFRAMVKCTGSSFRLQCTLFRLQFNFSVAVDPRPVNTTNVTALSLKRDLDVNGTLSVITNVTKETFKFEDVPLLLQ